MGAHKSNSLRSLGGQVRRLVLLQLIIELIICNHSIFLFVKECLLGFTIRVVVFIRPAQM